MHKHTMSNTNFLLSMSVKEVWKSVNIDEAKEKLTLHILYFLDSQCIYIKYFTNEWTIKSAVVQ